jgi:hypothetical protein
MYTSAVKLVEFSACSKKRENATILANIIVDRGRGHI